MQLLHIDRCVALSPIYRVSVTLKHYIDVDFYWKRKAGNYQYVYRSYDQEWFLFLHVVQTFFCMQHTMLFKYSLRPCVYPLCVNMSLYVFCLLS